MELAGGGGCTCCPPAPPSAPQAVTVRLSTSVNVGGDSAVSIFCVLYWKPFPRLEGSLPDGAWRGSELAPCTRRKYHMLTAVNCAPEETGSPPHPQNP